MRIVIPVGWRAKMPRKVGTIRRIPTLAFYRSLGIEFRISGFAVVRSE